MYSIVEVAGEQTRVSKGDVLRVPKLSVEPGKTVSFDKVMLVVNKNDVTVGSPMVAGAAVKATVVAHGKDKKVLVFKKKRRKNYRVLNGHRQEFTEIRIDAISVGKPAAKKEAAKEKDAAPEKKTAPKKAAPKKTAAAKSDATAAKKPAAKKAAKPAAKKPAAEKTAAAEKKAAPKKTAKPKAAPKKADAAEKGEEA